jgi:hypothetical protein
MRVVCTELNDFITNLQVEPTTSVLQQVVHISTNRRPLDNLDKHKAVRFNVTFHASAVVCLDDGGQYLLDYGEDCGIDYEDAEKELTGTQHANSLRKKLIEFCDECGLKVRPGIIEV